MKRTIEKAKDSKQFKYGNYNRYYGYRNENADIDKRLLLFQKDWFEGKSCLDIGCNVGHITLWIGKFYTPKSIKGIDIDFNLIKAARANVLHYIEDKNMTNVQTATKCNGSLINNQTSNDCIEELNECNATANVSSETVSRVNEAVNECNKTLNESCKSKSDLICNQSTTSSIKNTSRQNENKSVSSLTEDLQNNEDFQKHEQAECNNQSKEDYVDQLRKEKKFPYNVTFVTENFVPSSENLLKYTKQEYDIIICLSVTKWIQLNSGDEGLKLMFRKVFKLLNPGGKFILEPQPYKSYKRRKNLSAEIRNNYNNIRLKPEEFMDFLISEVGFATCTQLDALKHDKEGEKFRMSISDSHLIFFMLLIMIYFSFLGFRRPVYLLTKT